MLASNAPGAAGAPAATPSAGGAAPPMSNGFWLASMPISAGFYACTYVTLHTAGQKRNGSVFACFYGLRDTLI